MPAKFEEAVKAVEQGLDYAASETYTEEEERVVSVARAALRVLERAAKAKCGCGKDGGAA